MLAFLFTLLLVVLGPVAQDAGGIIGEAVQFAAPFLATFAGLAGLTVTFSEALDRIVHLDGLAARIRSWVVGVGITVAAAFLPAPFDVAVVAGWPIYYAVAGGILVSASANGLWGDWTKKLFELIRLRAEEK